MSIIYTVAKNKDFEMNDIKNIRLTKTEFILDTGETPLKLNYRNTLDKYIIDISSMNLINATKVAIMCSTYCFIKGFKKKLCWIVQDEEIRNAISILRLRNIEQITTEQINKMDMEYAS